MFSPGQGGQGAGGQAGRQCENYLVVMSEDRWLEQIQQQGGGEPSSLTSPGTGTVEITGCRRR